MSEVTDWNYQLGQVDSDVLSNLLDRQRFVGRMERELVLLEAKRSGRNRTVASSTFS
ncbi:MAG: hypothetical protein ACPGQI_01525 [Gammaproteobacteria bacterium]